ncbi:hypothetical protein H0H81_012129, partial [Sphagnurus paluster]
MPTPVASTVRELAPLILMSSARRDLEASCVAKSLVNVTELNILWQPGAASRTGYSPYCPILAQFLPVLGCNLLSLSLDIPSSIFGAFAPSSTQFTHLNNLQELKIRFFLDIDKNGNHEHVPENIEPLAFFINGLSPTLAALEVETSGHILLSSFFNAMTPFPCLKKLRLFIPFDLIHIQDPSGLNRLLRHHTLTDLTLRCRLCPVHYQPQLFNAGEWFKLCFQGVFFDEIQKLQLGFGYPFRIEPDHLEPMKPLSLTTTSLTVMDVCLSHTQVVVMFSTLDWAPLTFLSLWVETVSPELIELLAAQCPRLNRLVLETDNISAAEGDRIHSNE